MAFKENNWSQVKSFKVIDERGQLEEGEGVGVKRDVIATFWQQLFASASLGDKEKVPCIRHDFQKSEWQAIARILVYLSGATLQLMSVKYTTKYEVVVLSRVMKKYLSSWGITKHSIALNQIPSLSLSPNWRTRNLSSALAT